MPLPWHRLHRQLIDSTRRKSFETAFAALLRSDTAFDGGADLADLLERLHGTAAPQPRKNAALRALVRAAQGAQAERPDTALTAVLLALWPGLDAVYGRLRRYFQSDPEDLPGEILTRATEIIRTMDLDRVSQVAATVVRSTERDVIRGRLRSIRPVTWPEDAVAPSPDDRIQVRQLLHRLGADAGLVAAVAVDGQSCAEAGRALGLKPDTALKRYRRARAGIPTDAEDFSFGPVRFGAPKRLFPCSNDH